MDRSQTKPLRASLKSPVESYLGISRASETGWDRIKSLFIIRSTLPIPEELRDVSRVVYVAAIGGFFFGGMIGFRQMSEKYIMLNQNTKFSSVMQAQRGLHSAALMGFTSRGLRWGVRLGAASGIFYLSAVLLETYRDKNDGLNYLTAGGLLGGLYRINWGLKPFIGGATLGLLITFPLSILLFCLEKLAISKEGKFKEREELFIARCERRNYWVMKEKETSSFIEGIGENATGMEDHYKIVPKRKETKFEKWLMKWVRRIRNGE